MALGATSAAVVWHVAHDGARLTLAGLALGAAWALAASGGLSSYLYGVTRNDPLAFGLATATLAVASLLACVFPARRAAQVDPVQALRSE
jgi:ABC-type lipoprotein release transport system permease subunit